MTSSSTEAAIVRGLEGSAVCTPGLGGDLRRGTWTRMGGSTVLGDAVTEATLTGVAESVRAAARAQGYAVGWAEGRRAAEESARADAERAADRRAEADAQRAVEHDRAVAALRAAAQRLDERAGEVCAAVEARALEIALTLAEAVVGREVALGDSADAVRRALSLVPAGATVTVRLHPLDRAGLDTSALAEPGSHCLTLRDDPAMTRGDAVAETETGVVDAGVAAALDRVREVLAP